MRTKLNKTLYLAVVGVLLFVMAFQGYKVFADPSDDVVTATINYYYYDENKQDHKGTSPFPSFVANMPKGSAAITQKSPIVPGFSPCNLSKEPLNYVTISFNEDSETDVFYFPAEVNYLIRLFKQDLNSDDYTVSEIISSKGVTGSEPHEFADDFVIPSLGKTLEQAYDGFTLMYHVPEVIAADGSTEFECYYDRNYYLVSLDLGDGAYGVEPLYVPYEYPISLGTPVKTGYQFDGWEIKREDTNEALDELPATMPAYNIHCKAKWKAVNNVNYKIVYCNADVDDGSGTTKYSHWGDKTLSALPDTELSLSSVISANKNDITTFTDYQYFTFDPVATAANNSETIRVKSDGSTIIRLYYKRNKYKLRFVYLKYSSSTSYTAGSPVSSVTGNHQYVLVNTNKDRSKALTNNNAADNMRALTDFNNTNFNYLWTLVPVSGGYNIRYSNGQFLSADFTASGTGKPAVMSNTPMLFNISYYGDTSNYFLITTVYNNKTYYLNDKSNNGTRVQVYPSEKLETANRWQLYDYADATFLTTSSEIKVGTATGSGNFPSDITWGGTLSDFPEVDTSSGITSGEFTSNNEKYKYVELVSEYNASIEDIWPADVISPVGNYSFGSWSTQAGTQFRAKNSSHANIVGRFPYLSSDMIVDPSYVYDPANPSSIAQSLYAWWGSSGNNISEHRIKIFYEALDPDAPGVTEYKGKYYLLDHTVEAVAAHNGNTRIDPFTYKGYTIIPSDSGGHANSKATEEGQYQDPNDSVWTTEFHYTRNTYSLSYYNYNTDYSTGTDTSSIRYGTALAGFEPAGTPPYPEGLKPDSYEFAGWYDSDTYDNLFDWSSTMPDSDVVAYAYWRPKTFTFKFYNDESDYQNDAPSYIYECEGVYGEKLDVSEALANLDPPKISSSTGDYEAAETGWYYYDENGEIHAFDPETMMISEGMDLFMKWSSTVPASFTMHYYLRGTENSSSPVSVAPDTNGYSFVGLTRTFKAKVENDLNDDYRECYFPDRSSTSILMKADNDENVKSFLYTYREKVPYTVRYIAKDGPNAGQEIYESKTVNDNKKAVVTEKFVHIPQYIPTSYYITKTLIVSDDPDEEAAQNVITFYYNVDYTNMPYHIKYMVEDDNGTVIQDIDGKNIRFKEKNFIDGYAEKGTSHSFSINNYAGYTLNSYKEIIYDANDTPTPGALNPLEENTASVTVTMNSDANSKEIHIYYLKKSYPVKVIYQITSPDNDKIMEFNQAIEAIAPGLLHDESDENKVIIDGTTYYKSFYKVIEDQKFNTSCSETAYNINGFLLVGGEEKTRVVSDDDAEMTNNRIVFSYTALEEVMFFYYAVLPHEGAFILGDPKNPKLLSYNEETVPVGIRPTNTVEAKLDNDVYKFTGWYTDEECTIPVAQTSINGTDVLSGTSNSCILPPSANTNKSYYAKYDYRRGNLTISITGGDITEGGQQYEFIVKGRDSYNNWIQLAVCIDPTQTQTVTIKDIPIGNYDISQNNWSWRYQKPSVQHKTVEENSTATSVFTETTANKKWLDGNAFIHNVL